MLTYTALKDKAKEFLAATGLKTEEFAQLLPVFKAAYQALYPMDRTAEGKTRQRQPGGGTQATLRTVEDKLLFILVYHKTYPLQTMHGLQFGLGQPQTHYWIHRLLPVLQRALAELKMVPEREGEGVVTAEVVNEPAPDLLIDGSERRRQRPTKATPQRAHYSGKKKAHTDKNIILVNEHTGKVAYLSPTVEGKTHDKKAADEAEIAFPKGATLGKDTGFQGYEPAGVITHQAQKKPKGKPLSKGDKALNRMLSSARVKVEHAIAGIKRCRIVKDVFRLTKQGISDVVMEIACALHNLRVAHRHSLPTFDLLNLVSNP